MILERTRGGLPALWECGGANWNFGSSQIICEPNGQPKIANWIGNKDVVETFRVPLTIAEKKATSIHYTQPMYYIKKEKQ